AVRLETSGIDPARQVFECGEPAERTGDTATRVLTDKGDDVRPVTDVPQRRASDRKHRPSHLVTVCRGNDPFDARLAQRFRQQCEWCGGSEPHGLTLMVVHELLHPT